MIFFSRSLIFSLSSWEGMDEGKEVDTKDNLGSRHDPGYFLESSEWLLHHLHRHRHARDLGWSDGGWRLATERDPGPAQSWGTWRALPRPLPCPRGSCTDGSLEECLLGSRGLMVVTPDIGSKPDSRNAGMILISNSNRLEARARTTSSPHVVGSNISVFHFFCYKTILHSV